MSKQVRVVAIVRVRPDTQNEMEQAARACISATRDEPGCLSYVLHRDLQDPHRFAFIETWRDQAALEHHREQPHMRVFKAALGPIADGALEVMTLEEIA